MCQSRSAWAIQSPALLRTHARRRSQQRTAQDKRHGHPLQTGVALVPLLWVLSHSSLLAVLGVWPSSLRLVSRHGQAAAGNSFRPPKLPGKDDYNSHASQRASATRCKAKARMCNHTRNLQNFCKEPTRASRRSAPPRWCKLSLRSCKCPANSDKPLGVAPAPVLWVRAARFKCCREARSRKHASGGSPPGVSEPT